MEAYALLEESQEFRKKIPLVVIGGICVLAVYFWILVNGLQVQAETDFLPIIAIGAFMAVLSLLEPQIGLAFLIFSIGVSPEFKILGVPNLRFEDFLFPIIFFSWFIRFAAEKEQFAQTNLKVPILLTVLLSLISSLYNAIYAKIDLGQCFFRNGKSIEYFMIFLITLNSFRKGEEIRRFAYLITMVGALVGISGIIQGIQTQQKVTGPAGETSNILGAYYTFHICIALGLLTSNARYRLPLLICTGLMIIPLLNTLARASYVAFFIGILAMFMVRRHTLTGLIIIGSVVGVLGSMELTNRVLQILGVFQGDLPSSLDARIKGWNMFLDFFFTDGPLVGFGIGDIALGAFDSEYVRIIFELGIPGLILFLWMFWRILCTSFRLSRDLTDPVHKGFAFGCFGGTLALLVHSMAATTFTTIRTAESFFFTLGILYALTRKAQEQAEMDEELPGDLPLRNRIRGPAGLRPSGLGTAR